MAEMRPNWFRRRALDLREIWGWLVLGSTGGNPPRMCGAKHYGRSGLTRCSKLDGHVGYHENGMLAWSDDEI